MILLRCLAPMLLALAIPFTSCAAPKSIAHSIIKGGGPSIAIAGGDTLDFGRGAPGIFRRKLTVRNAGGDTLVIQGDPDTDCGCISGELDRMRIAPGDSAMLSVRFLAGPTRRRLTHNIILWSNDPVRPSATIVVTVDVVPDIEVTPSTFLLKDLDAKKETGASVLIRNTGDASITFTAPKLLDTAGMIVRLNLPEKFTLRPGEERSVEARVTAARKDIPAAYLRFTTTSTSSPELRVYIVRRD